MFKIGSRKLQMTDKMNFVTIPDNAIANLNWDKWDLISIYVIDNYIKLIKKTEDVKVWSLK